MDPGESLDESKIIQMAIEQNDIDKKIEGFHMKIVHKTKTRNNYIDIIMELDPKTFSEVMNNSHLYIGLSRCEIIENFHIIKCVKCCEYGHTTKYCRNQTTCSKCAEEHEEKYCKSEVLQCPNCSKRNTKFKLNIETGHNSWDPSCPSYQHILHGIKKKVCYSA